MFHIVNSCPQTKLEGDLPQLHLAEDAAIQKRLMGKIWALLLPAHAIFRDVLRLVDT